MLGVPAARRLLVSLAAAWLSFGAVGLVVLLAVHRQTGSFTASGVAAGAFAIGSGALAPVRGRTVDRRGGRALLPLAYGYAAALAGLGGLAAARAPAWSAVLVAGFAGCSAPPLVASARAAWSRLLDAEALRRAYGLTSLLGDAGVVVAPALGGALFAWSSWAAIGVCAGAAVVAATTVAPLVAPAEPRAGDGALRGELRLVLAVSAALGAALGLTEVAVPARATQFGAGALVGFLLGAFALGSIGGAVWSGRRGSSRPPSERYLRSVLVIGVLVAPAAAATSAAALAPLLVLAGVGYGPATVALFEALDALAPRRAVEALTWVTTAEAIGTAGGAAASGALGQHVAGWLPFVVASAVLAPPAALALVTRRRRRTFTGSTSVRNPPGPSRARRSAASIKRRKHVETQDPARAARGTRRRGGHGRNRPGR